LGGCMKNGSAVKEGGGTSVARLGAWRVVDADTILLQLRRPAQSID
jgi:hypothetical protein